MADFNTHVFGAAAVVSLGATCCTKLLNLSLAEGLMLMLAGMVGGLLPDIDLKRSQPSRALFSALGVIAAMAWLFANMPEYTGLELWLGAILVYILVRIPLWRVFHAMTTHRGALHSLTAAATAGILMCCFAWQQMQASALQSWLLGLFMSLGYVVHLLLDEIYSVDFAGVRIKRSFGSAIKPIDVQRLPASCLVLFIAFFAWFWTAPYQEAITQLNERYTDWRTALVPPWLPQLLEPTQLHLSTEPNQQ
ncbi:MAG: metal-dependent hydrolase [Granulosicoccus sp.]|nr:metal-dependent hydrolase [Granulosicoccus sp.]